MAAPAPPALFSKRVPGSWKNGNSDEITTGFAWLSARPSWCKSTYSWWQSCTTILPPLFSGMDPRLWLRSPPACHGQPHRRQPLLTQPAPLAGSQPEAQYTLLLPQPCPLFWRRHEPSRHPLHSDFPPIAPYSFRSALLPSPKCSPKKPYRNRKTLN